MNITRVPGFESETCSRCGGSGNYSYCEMYGTTCFKCGGSGRMLTVRGRAAVAWQRARRTIKVADVQPGMRVRSGTLKPFVVVAVSQELVPTSKSLKDGVWVDNPRYVHLHGEPTGLMTFEHLDIEVLPRTPAEQVAEREAAIAYQATLTKAGKPRVRS